MGFVDRKARLPYLESHGNEFDAIARLGVLGSGEGPREARIGGERFVRRGAWGHLLNAHYLHPMEQEWRALQDGKPNLGIALKALPFNEARTPRLFEYFGGASPPARSAPVPAPTRNLLEPMPRRDAA
jgi:hypothetical protein